MNFPTFHRSHTRQLRVKLALKNTRLSPIQRFRLEALRDLLGGRMGEAVTGIPSFTRLGKSGGATASKI